MTLVNWERCSAGADLGLLAGVSVSRSHVSFYLRTGGVGGGVGDDTCVDAFT